MAMVGSSKKKELRLAAALVLIAVVCQLALLGLRRTASVVSGDEGTFLAMTESMALDGDLLFAPEDLERIEAASHKGRKAVILQDTGSGTAYSKPAAYGLLAAPWYRLFGASGLVALNILALAGALVLGWGALARSGARHASVTVATFAGAGVLMSYTVWTMSDSLQASLVLGGLALALASARPARPTGTEGAFERFVSRLLESRWAPTLGVALLGVVFSMRLPNLALAVAPILAWLFCGRWRRSIWLAVVLAVVVLGGLAANQLLAGAPVPYKAVRATFNPQSGYPVGEQAETARRQFSENVALATQRIGVLPEWDAEVSLYSAAYFWVGRHTGVLWYLPFALVLLVAGLRRPDAVTWALLLSVGALAVFYLVWMPRNYFGGATFVGNRYFLTGYAALLLLPAGGAGRRGVALTWLIAIAAFLSAVTSVAGTRDRDPSSQNHAYAGIFRWLPYEATAGAIDGRSDVYWTEEFFRFVDPYAVVDATGFSLRAGDPWAEVLHASQREASIVRFLARSERPVGKIFYRGQGQDLAFTLEPMEAGAWGLIEIELRPTRQRHRYWFHPTERLHTRRHRFRLQSEEDGALDEAPSAQLHYLGSMRLVPKFFRGIIMTGELPGGGRAGKRTAVPIRVRNTGYRFWSSSEMVPTRLGYRIYALPRKAGDRPVGGRLQDFEGRVPRAHEVDVALDVRWPRKPGRYELIVDLNLGGAVWFESWNQQPLARRVVRVRAATQSDSTQPAEAGSAGPGVAARVSVGEPRTRLSDAP